MEQQETNQTGERVVLRVIRRAQPGIFALAATVRLRLQWLKHSTGVYACRAQFIDLINQFCRRSFRFHLKPTKAAEPDNESKRKRKFRAFDEITLTSGARWFRNANGFWYLFKSQVPENQSAVLEFLNYYDVTKLIHRKYGYEGGIRFIHNLQALVDFGFGLPIQYLDKSYYGEE
jgi:hypothetical protein